MTLAAQDLSHVYWIGGSACAGKSSVVEKISQRRGLAVYHCDDYFHEHKERVDRLRHPHFFRIMDKTPEELWMRPAAEQVEELVAFYREELEMVFHDLMEERTRAPVTVLAEGAGLMPALLAALDPSLVTQGVWLVATADFRQQRYPSRGPWVRQLLDQCPEPEKAWANWMDRDDLFATRVSQEAEILGARRIIIDGSRSVDRIAEEVMAQL